MGKEINKIHFDATKVDNTIVELKGFGDEKIKLTNKCLFKDGEPWLPVMGEMHYSRVPEKEWRRSLQLMKDGGVEIIASYVFWNHHESQKGSFRFDGNRNIKKFVQLCDELGLYFFLRIGPWCHGEARNGGLPDWLVEECNVVCKNWDMTWPFSGVGTRRLVEPYMTYLKYYMKKICDEVKDFKNIIGLQVDNELTDAPEYLKEIKELAIEYGIKVPLYTATGWGNANLDNTDLIPVWGGYPEAPWERENDAIEKRSVYTFRKVRNDSAIGADVISGNAEQKNSEANNMPYMTCELGPGNQISYHRRPLISEQDVYAVSVCALGSGCNLLGYYVYRGGLNPTDEIYYMQESIATGYPNDYPIVTYDFQAPIGSDGQIRKSYFSFKELFTFCNKCGRIIAPMSSLLPAYGAVSSSDFESVRCAVRTDGKSGFLFVNNHNRIKQLKEHSNVEFIIKTNDEEIVIPFEKIPSGSSFFVPFGLKFGDLKIKYSTAMLVDMDNDTLEFRPIKGIEPLICLENGEIIKLEEKQQICGINVIMHERYYPEESIGEKLEVQPLKENTIAFGDFEHLRFSDRTKEYRIILKKNTKYIKVNWQGNVAALYADGKLVTDNYFYGEPWIIDVSEICDKEVIIKIQAINEDEISFTYLDVIPKTGAVTPTIEGFREEFIYV